MHTVETAPNFFDDHVVCNKGFLSKTENVKVTPTLNQFVSVTAKTLRIDSDGKFGTAPIGAIVPIAHNIAGAMALPASGVVSSNGWMRCDGQPIPIGNKLEGNTPNINNGVFIRGSSLANCGVSGGADTHTHTMDEKLATIPLAHVHTSAHTHAIGSHTHGTIPAHTHTLASHTHTISHEHHLQHDHDKGTALLRLHANAGYSYYEHLALSFTGYASEDNGYNKVTPHDTTSFNGVSVRGRSLTAVPSLNGGDTLASGNLSGGSTATLSTVVEPSAGAGISIPASVDSTGSASPAVTSSLTNYDAKHRHVNVASSNIPIYISQAFLIKVN